MMKARAASISFAERCRNILAANWRAHLNTIKADAKGSKNEIYASKVHYAFQKGRPYLWIREGDLHNMNTIIDERGSLSICSSIPGPLLGLLKSIRKLPARVALSGDVVRLKDKKVQVVVDSIKESILLEHKVASQASYTSSAVLSSAGISCRSRSEIFQEILNEIGSYNIYKFDIRSCTYIDGSGSIYDVELDNFKAPTADLLCKILLTRGRGVEMLENMVLFRVCVFLFFPKLWPHLVLLQFFWFLSKHNSAFTKRRDIASCVRRYQLFHIGLRGIAN